MNYRCQGCGAVLAEKLKLLTIHHRHGQNVYLCASARVVQQKLKEYVKDEWHNEFDEPMPEEPATAVEEYFARMNDRDGGEYWEEDNINIEEEKPA